MYIGYARVSTAEQHLDLQLLGLKNARCKKIFQEKISGKALHRLALDAAIAALKPGDTLVVWHLDRLGRNARELINLEYELTRRGIGLISLMKNIDTKTPIGIYQFHVTCANAQLESARISERTKAGMVVARLQGHYPGRPRRLNQRQIQRVRYFAEEMRWSIAAIAAKFRVGKATIWRALQNN